MGKFHAGVDRGNRRIVPRLDLARVDTRKRRAVEFQGLPLRPGRLVLTVWAEIAMGTLMICGLSLTWASDI